MLQSLILMTFKKKSDIRTNFKAPLYLGKQSKGIPFKRLHSTGPFACTVIVVQFWVSHFRAYMLLYSTIPLCSAKPCPFLGLLLFGIQKPESLGYFETGNKLAFVSTIYEKYNLKLFSKILYIFILYFKRIFCII